MTRWWLVPSLTAAMLAAPLAAPSRAADDALLPGDDAVRQRIEQRLEKAGLEQNADIRVSVVSGVAHLTGVAVSYAAYRVADRAARKEARSVVNEVRVVPEQPRSDRAIQKDAMRDVLGWDRYGPFDAVSVEVEQGIVGLQGWVDSPAKKDEIEERLSHVPGVRDVHNDLRLQGFSVADRQLRTEVFQRIYGNPLFERWAGVNDPPVRVFVERGRIILAGLVASRLEKVAAGNIARGTLGFSVNNQLRIESEERRKEDRKKEKDEG